MPWLGCRGSVGPSLRNIGSICGAARVSGPSIFGLADDVRKAIEDLTKAREMLNDLAEEPPNN